MLAQGAARDGRAGAGLTQGTSGNGGQARARVWQVVTGGSAGCNQGTATGGSGGGRKFGMKMFGHSPFL